MPRAHLLAALCLSFFFYNLPDTYRMQLLDQYVVVGKHMYYSLVDGGYCHRYFERMKDGKRIHVCVVLKRSGV